MNMFVDVKGVCVAFGCEGEWRKVRWCGVEISN